MASTSTSSAQKSFKYDVFLSFRGEDTRHKFVSHLYKALDLLGIRTYIDDEEIEKGETIDTQLKESIEDSRFFIIVFSKDYAGSSWCLDELIKIMECRTGSERTVYPVFYDVEPTEIRNQSGVVKEAFKKHENKEAADKWRKALKEAADLAGWESKKTANGNESKLIQELVDVIVKKTLWNNLSVDGNLVGMETRIEAVLSSLELDADDVRMIGIWGMGGGGKTTLASAVFDRVSIQFDGKAFVENVREVSESSLYGLNKLQQRILHSVLSNKGITVNSVHEGTKMMKTLLRGRKVLIVLDDVDDIKQLEALAGEPDWFKLGSRVIITTRNKQVLSAHGVKFIDVNLLSRAEAIRLLSKYAFKRDIPNEGYEGLSGQVVKYADGLPLTIKVLGSMLYGQNEREWIDTLERLKTIPLEETLKKLELSYKNLEDDYKQIFLDVACLLKGWSKEDAIIALESCGFHARNGLRVLEQRSLITCDEFGYLGMHDHIEEMGKDIVRRVNYNKPERYSRLWIKEEIEDILANGSATQATTQCIQLNARGLNFEILMKGLANMEELRFLHVSAQWVSQEEVSKWNFDEDSLHLPNALRFLRWRSYPFSSLPKTLQAKNLVALEMIGSNMVQLWKDGEEKPFLKLRFLKFTRSPKLRTLDLSVAPNLETLILESCEDLVEVDFQVNPNLKELSIWYCHRLEILHMPAELTYISLEDDYMPIFLDVACLLKGWYKEDAIRALKSCGFYAANGLKVLKRRSLINISEDWKLGMHDHIEEIGRNIVRRVNPNKPEMHSRLWIAKEIVDILANDSGTQATQCISLDALDEDAEEFNFEILMKGLAKMKELRFLYVNTYGYADEEEVSKWKLDEDSLHLPYALRFLRWRAYPFSSLPKTLKNLVGLDMSFGNMVQLWKDGEEKPFLKLRFLKFTWSKLRTLDLSVAPNLESLILESCEDLVEVHFQVTPNLEELRIKHCERLEKLHMPAESPKLRSLNLWKLKKLRTLHLGVTPNLETLRVRACDDLVELQIIPAECPKLVNLDLSNCIQVAELPEEIGRLECLEEVDITGTGISHLPESILRVKGLRIVGSCGSTSEIKTSDENQEQKSPVLRSSDDLNQEQKSPLLRSSDDFEQLQRPE